MQKKGGYPGRENAMRSIVNVDSVLAVKGADGSLMIITNLVFI